MDYDEEIRLIGITGIPKKELVYPISLPDSNRSDSLFSCSK